MGMRPLSLSIYDSRPSKEINGNPNPRNCKIIECYQNAKYLLVKVNYPDCTNFEGDKILLYENCTIEQLIAQGSIDPHFSNNKKYLSPIARFEPTKEGFKMAWKIFSE